MSPPPDPGEGLVRLEVRDHAVVLDPADGGRAVSWRKGDHELLFHQGDDPVEHGMYAMAPWAGRLRDNVVEGPGGSHCLPETYAGWALHGTVLDQPAVVESTTILEGRAEAVLATSAHPAWPWPLVVRTRWLVEQDRVTIEIELESSQDAMPYVVGWHPWFRREIAGASATWEAEAAGMLVRGADALPASLSASLREGPYDDAFVVPDGRAKLTWPGVLSLEIESDGCWFVVYDERPECLCVEPQSGPPDGLSEHPWHVVDRLGAGQSATFTTTWFIRDLQGDPA